MSGAPDGTVREGLPVGVLRAGVLVAGVVAWLTVVAGRPLDAVAAVVLGLVLLCAYAPGGAAPTVALLGLVVLQLRTGDLDLRLGLTVAAVAAHHALCALAGALPADARLDVRALRRPVQGYALVTSGSLALLGLALAVRGRVAPDALVLEATVVLVVAAVVVTVAVVRAQGRRQ